MKKGWRKASIGDTCDLATGGTPTRTRPEYFADGEIKWLVSGDVHQKEIFDCDGRITEAGLQNSNARYLPLNSVIIALNGQGKTRGTVALLRTLATCNQSIVSIAPKGNDKLIPEFLFYNLHSRYHEIRKMTGDAGSERRGLNMPLIRSIEIPIAPIEEQRKIVTILDEAFEGLDRARANTEANLVSAKELFESFLAKVFNGQEWPTKTLDQISKNLDRRRVPITKANRKLGTVPYYGASGVVDYVADFIFDDDLLLVSED